MRSAKLLSLCLLSFIGSPAADASEDAVRLGAATAVTAGLATGVLINQMKEQLEYRAIQHVLIEMPELTAFELKHFGWEAKTRSDLSNTTNVPFIVRPKDGDPFVLLMVVSHGWIDPSAIHTDRIHFEKLDRARWNSLLSAYISAAGYVTVDNAEAIPGFVRNPNRKLTADIESKGLQVLSVGKTRYGQTSTFSFASVEEITGRGLSIWTGDRTVLFPFQKLKGDEYLIKDLDENIRVVYNEKTMGIFYKHTAELVQLKPSMVKKISKAVLLPAGG
mgnify:CR=1 FL=1|tara:strand:- start:139 stop:966 length:828 start_codon:yes stop_codon:yes gene_type:complete